MDKSFLEVKEILNKNSSKLKRKNKIRNKAIGFKITNGKVTDQISILAFVNKKQNEMLLHNDNIEPLPTEIDGVPTDVIEIQFRPRLSNNNVPTDDSRYRPVVGGMATIRYPTPATGTLGLIVKGRNDPFNLVRSISNNHVHSNEDLEGQVPPAATKGDPLLQPGAHGNAQFPNDKIGELENWGRLKPRDLTGRINYYDCAIGTISTENKPYEVMEIGKVKGWVDSDFGDDVLKRGRTTRKTKGRIQALDAAVTVDYTDNEIPVDFIEQILIVGDPVEKPFSLGGDSGSVVLSANTNSDGNYPVVGLLFAGGTTNDGVDITVASPIKRVIDDFNLEL